MAKQHGDYPCAPPERVAQLLSLGVGYEGYMQVCSADKTFVKIYPLKDNDIRRKTASVQPLIEKQHPIKSGKYQVRYTKDVYVFKDTFVRYMLSEGVGIYSTFFVNGYVRLRESDDRVFATIGVTANSPAQNIGTVKFSGIARLFSGSVCLSDTQLELHGNHSFVQSGWSLVGNAEIQLPTRADGNIVVQLDVGYIYDSGVGRSASSGKLKIEIGVINN